MPRMDMEAIHGSNIMSATIRADIKLNNHGLEITGIVKMLDRSGVVVRAKQVKPETYPIHLICPGTPATVTMESRQGTYTVAAALGEFTEEDYHFDFRAAAPTVERRTIPRFVCYIPIEFREHGNEAENWREAIAVDISRHGMKLLAPGGQVPDKIEMRFFLLGHKGRVETVASVKHKTLDGEGASVGIAFDEIPRIQQAWFYEMIR